MCARCATPPTRLPWPSPFQGVTHTASHSRASRTRQNDPVKQHVLFFDLDGTVADSGAGIMGAMNEVLAARAWQKAEGEGKAVMAGGYLFGAIDLRAPGIRRIQHWQPPPEQPEAGERRRARKVGNAAR